MPSSGWRRWLIRLGGIVWVVFGLRTRWTPNVGTKYPRAIESQTRGYEMKVWRAGTTTVNANYNCPQVSHQ
jgi:hypothetical protein